MRTLYFAAVVSSFVFLFFLAYSQRLQIGCLPYFHTWCGLSANLECMSETCCRRLAENRGRKDHAKIAVSAPSHNFDGYIFATKAHMDNRKKVVKERCMLHMSSQRGEFRPTSGWDRLAGLGRRSEFQRVSRIGFVTASTSLNGGQANFKRCFAVSCAGTLPGAKFTLRPSLYVLLYWHCYCTALKQWAWAKLCSVIQRMELRNFRSSSFSTEGATYILRAAVTLGIGHILGLLLTKLQIKSKLAAFCDPPYSLVYCLFRFYLQIGDVCSSTTKQYNSVLVSGWRSAAETVTAGLALHCPRDTDFIQLFKAMKGKCSPTCVSSESMEPVTLCLHWRFNIRIIHRVPKNVPLSACYNVDTGERMIESTFSHKCYW